MEIERIPKINPDKFTGGGQIAVTFGNGGASLLCDPVPVQWVSVSNPTPDRDNGLVFVFDSPAGRFAVSMTEGFARTFAERILAVTGRIDG